jgi:hypothetical protein
VASQNTPRKLTVFERFSTQKYTTGRETAVLMKGFLVDHVPTGADAAVNKIGRWHKPWFFEHARAMLGGGTEVVEYANVTGFYSNLLIFCRFMLENAARSRYRPLGGASLRSATVPSGFDCVKLNEI